MYFPHKAKVVVQVKSAQKDKYGNFLPDTEASEAASKTFKCYAKPLPPVEMEMFGIDTSESAFRLTADYRWTGKDNSKIELHGHMYRQVGDPEMHTATSLTRHAKVILRTAKSDGM